MKATMGRYNKINNGKNIFVDLTVQNSIPSLMICGSYIGDLRIMDEGSRDLVENYIILRLPELH